MNRIVMCPATGWTDLLNGSASTLAMDAGLIPVNVPAPSTELPAAKVGPVRSGRLVYADIQAFFPESCLIYAFASAEVLVELPKCAFVYHDIQGGGYMLDINEMINYTKANRSTNQPIDYASNVFSSDPPEGGVEATRLDEYAAWLNQSAWEYDPLYQSWWRYVDNADPQSAGELHSEMDREAAELEQICSGWAIGRRARMAASETDSIMTKIAGSLEAIDAREVYAAARQGDEPAVRILTETCRTLGTAIANVVALLHPERVILGGGVSLMGPIFWKLLHREFRSRVMPVFAPHVDLVWAKLRENVVLFGTLCLGSNPS